MTAVNHLITKHLDIWTSAIEKRSRAGRGSSGAVNLYGIKKLRDLILELAVRGKLSSQDPADGDATNLLRAVEQARRDLVKLNQMKKQKALPAIGDEEKPYRIPHSWAFIRLGDLTNYGITDKAEARDVDEETWVLELEDVEKESSRLLQRVTFIDRRFKSSKNRFSKGDVVYGKLRPYLDKVLVANTSGVCTTEMLPMRAYCGVSPEFLRLVLKSPTFIRYADDSTHGMNLPRLGTEKARMAVVPFPPTAEQQRIVAKFDELMGLCDALEAQAEDSLKAHQTLVETCLATLTNSQTPKDLAQNWTRFETHFDTLFTTEESVERLRHTIYQLAIQGKLVAQDPTEMSAQQLLMEVCERRQELLEDGCPNEKEAKTQRKKQEKQVLPEGLPELPRGWGWVTLMQVSLMVIDCKNKTAPYSENGVRLIRTTNVRHGQLNDKDQKYVDEKTFEAWSLRAKPEPGDLLITREAPMGEACLIPEGERLCLGQRMMLARLVPDTINKEYLLITFLSPDLMDRVQDKPLGMTVEHLRVGGVETLLVPVPPKAEQDRIVERVHHLIELCRQMELNVQIERKLRTALANTLVEKVA